MIKSITTSPKAKIRSRSKVKYDFSQVFENLSDINEDVNERIQKYEDCQSLSVRRAGQIRSR